MRSLASFIKGSIPPWTGARTPSYPSFNPHTPLAMPERITLYTAKVRLQQTIIPNCDLQALTLVDLPLRPEGELSLSSPPQ